MIKSYLLNMYIYVSFHNHRPLSLQQEQIDDLITVGNQLPSTQLPSTKNGGVVER